MLNHGQQKKKFAKSEELNIVKETDNLISALNSTVLSKREKKFNLVNLVFDLPLWYARVTLVTISVFYYLNFEPFIFPTGSNFFLGRETFL